MTDDDRFELGLAALRPRGPSAELNRRIAEDLAAAKTPNRNVSEELDLTYPQRTSLTRRVSMAGGLLAASLAAVIVWRGGDQTIELQPTPTLETSVATAFDDSFPSLWSYRSALSRSSRTVDELLNKYAARTLEHKPGGAPDLFIARFNSDTDSLLGEL